MDKKQKLAFYDFLRSLNVLHRMKEEIPISIYSEGIGLHTKKIYMTRWFGIVCLRIHNFASFLFLHIFFNHFYVRKIEGHRIVESINHACIWHLWNTKHFCNMLTYGVIHTKGKGKLIMQYPRLTVNIELVQTVIFSSLLDQLFSKQLASDYLLFNAFINPEHKDLRISYLIFDYWALHICLDITVCSALVMHTSLEELVQIVWNATFLFLGKINLSLLHNTSLLQIEQNEAAIILMLAASNMISKNYDYFLSYSLQEQQASNHFSFNQLIIYLHSILIGFLLAVVCIYSIVPSSWFLFHIIIISHVLVYGCHNIFWAHGTSMGSGISKKLCLGGLLMRIGIALYHLDGICGLGIRNVVEDKAHGEQLIGVFGWIYYIAPLGGLY
ncbi:hypothetical protein ACJX0J_039873 [Zea mays]